MFISVRSLIFLDPYSTITQYDLVERLYTILLNPCMPTAAKSCVKGTFSFQAILLKVFSLLTAFRPCEETLPKNLLVGVTSFVSSTSRKGLWERNSRV